MMRFLLGAVTVLVLLPLAIFFYFKLGLLNTRADVAPTGKGGQDHSPHTQKALRSDSKTGGIHE